jgi:nitrate/nitrite transport system substrate-binding protein
MTEHTPALEKPSLTLGYMPLTDSLPLLVAQDRGLFQAHGLDVTLQQEVSWANIRDKVVVGQLDAAPMLAPMLLATHAGLGGLRKAMAAPMALGLNGNALTISTQLSQQLAAVPDVPASGNVARDALERLAQLVQERKTRDQPALVLATVFPFSIHNLLLRHGLASVQINPDTDIKLVVLPPSQMVDHLKQNHIDGFFAGAPWNTVAIQAGIAECLISGPDLWPAAPDKVLGITRDWAEQHPHTLQALMQALYEAGEWLEHHREEAATILGRYIDLPAEALLPALTGQFCYRLDGAVNQQPDMLVFHRYLANYPWQSHGEWFVQQLQRWGWANPDIDASALVAECYRPDLYHQALGHTALPIEPSLSLDQDQRWTLSTTQGGFVMARTGLLV